MALVSFESFRCSQSSFCGEGSSDLTAVLKKWSDINAENFDEKVLVPRGE